LLIIGFVPKQPTDRLERERRKNYSLFLPVCFERKTIFRRAKSETPNYDVTAPPSPDKREMLMRL
jgi:hypothetical protein